MLMVAELKAFESKYTVQQKEKKRIFDDTDGGLLALKKKRK